MIILSKIHLRPDSKLNISASNPYLLSSDMELDRMKFKTIISFHGKLGASIEN